MKKVEDFCKLFLPFFQIVFVVFLIYCFGLVLHKEYPETMCVKEVQDFGETYQILFETSNGNLYLYNTDNGDFVVGEFYSVIMRGNKTETVSDDKIVKLKYCGF